MSLVSATRRFREHAGVAQLVEQLIRNQQVSGSSPLAGSNRLNNLQGSSATGDCVRVGTM